MNSEENKKINLSNEEYLDSSINNSANILFDANDNNLNNEGSLWKLNHPEEKKSNNSNSSSLNSNSSRSTFNNDGESNKLLFSETSEIAFKQKDISSNIPILESSTEASAPIGNLVVNWKDELYKGNFMPAFCLLDQKKILVDDIIDYNTENRLLHLALSYSFTNVTRGLIEIFKCSLNLKNRFGHTPFHILCNNEQNDIFLFSYLIKNEDLQFDEKDRSGVTPLFFAIISKHNLAFLILLFKKANIYNIDDIGNNALYFSLSSDNKFALNFILRHCPKLSLNGKFFGNKVSLSEVLISSKERQITKYLIKYFHHKLDLEAIIASQKQKSQFNFYNNFNYDLFNTVYFYKTKNYIALINKLLSRNPLSRYTFTYYNIKFLLYDLIIPNMNENLKYFFIASYCVYISYVYFEFLKGSNLLQLNNSFSVISKTILFLLYQASSVVCLFIALIKFFFTKIPKLKSCYNNNISLSITNENFPYYVDDDEENLERNPRNNSKQVKEPYYDYASCQHNSDNAMNMIYQAVERNPLDIFFEEELCEICLIKKDKTTNHCYICNRCVKNFYFHSKLFNVCFHRQNIYYYILFYSSLMAIHISYIYFMIYKVSNDYSRAQNPDKDFVDLPLSLYQSEHFITNFVTFLVSLCPFDLLFVLFCIIFSVLALQNWLIMFCCIGYKVTYHNMFRMHKKAVGKLELRKSNICNIPQVNTVSICDFFINLFKA